MNKITLDSKHLRPATMAAMIADLLDSPLVNAMVIRSLITQLENSVGEEMSVEFLADAGITPGRGSAEYEVAAEWQPSELDKAVAQADYGAPGKPV